MRKANASQKNASAASTFMFVRAEKNPIKITTPQSIPLTKIQNLDDFRKITSANFGFIVVSEQSPILHQSKCKNLSEQKFAQYGHHWFSNSTLAEKSFSATPCDVCKPE